MSHGTKDTVQVNIEQLQSTFAKITVIVPKACVSAVYQRALVAQKDEVHTYGFPKGATPLLYIEHNYRASLLEHVEEFLFKYFVISFLHKKLLEKKIFIAGEPRLHTIVVDPQRDAEFHFDISVLAPIDLSRWKSLPFKAPKRKNYKDIDRQVDFFLEEEKANMKKIQECGTVSVGDWVCFDIALVDGESKEHLSSHRENLWLKIGNEEADVPFQELFIDKKQGDIFFTDAKCLQDYFASGINTNYFFTLEIRDVVYNSYFSLDHFRQHFRLRTNKEVQQKLIEVFSYRNDLSLRRAMAEEALALLTMKHHIEVPNYLILRQQQIVLDAVLANPDYQVYKMQSNFKENVKQLATKQVREMIIVDQLKHEENIVVTNDDLKGYLNLSIRPRTKEFIYFNVPNTKIDGQEMPMSSVALGHPCLREKTLNHIIYNLTKK